jgi:hypothetical protein
MTEEFTCYLIEMFSESREIRECIILTSQNKLFLSYFKKIDAGYIFLAKVAGLIARMDQESVLFLEFLYHYSEIANENLLEEAIRVPFTTSHDERVQFKILFINIYKKTEIERIRCLVIECALEFITGIELAEFLNTCIDLSPRTIAGMFKYHRTKEDWCPRENIKSSLIISAKNT